jgi:hypothetical protein
MLLLETLFYIVHSCSFVYAYFPMQSFDWYRKATPSSRRPATARRHLLVAPRCPTLLPLERHTCVACGRRSGAEEARPTLLAALSGLRTETGRAVPDIMPM